MRFDQKNKPELSVVVLGYQAGIKLKSFVLELVGLLEKDKIDYQIILVGNYWPNLDDITPQVVKELAQSNLRIKPIIEPKQGMMGWDMRSGLKAANGRFISIIDGDGQMPAQDVIKVYNKIKIENLDFVKTYRKERFDNLWRRIISVFYNLIFKILFPGLKVKDINSKPKVFSSELYRKLNLISNDWFTDTEMTIQLRRLKIKIAEIPTVFNQIEGRCSFVKFSTIFEFVKNLIKARIYESFNYWRKQ